MIHRIEALKEQIASVYAEARTYDGVNNDRVLEDAILAREAQREAAEEALGLIGSFDVEDDEV
jgi:hypothetical protein